MSLRFASTVANLTRGESSSTACCSRQWLWNQSLTRRWWEVLWPSPATPTYSGSGVNYIPRFRDFVTVEDLNVEIHLVKEGQIIGKDSKSQARMVHGIQVAIARGFIDNLREEVRKGMRE